MDRRKKFTAGLLIAVVIIIVTIAAEYYNIDVKALVRTVDDIYETCNAMDYSDSPDDSESSGGGGGFLDIFGGLETTKTPGNFTTTATGTTEAIGTTKTSGITKAIGTDGATRPNGTTKTIVTAKIPGTTRMPTTTVKSPGTTGTRNEPKAGNALFLSPFLENGRIEYARNQSKVTHAEMLNVESYAGYFTVSKKYNSNLFFWYFPAEDNPAGAPVMLFLEGAPGVSSLFSVFTRNGPFSVGSDGKMVMRKERWNKKHNMIYIDSPVGVGYSFIDSNTLLTPRNAIGEELYEVLRQFFELFPWLRKNDFFVVGESSAGQFVLMTAYQIHMKNMNQVADKQINLKGIAIGHGWIDPVNQLTYGQHLYNIGLIDSNEREQVIKMEDTARQYMRNQQYRGAESVIEKLIENSQSLLSNLTGIYTFGNMIRTVNAPISIAFNTMVQRDEIRRALHVGNRTYVFYSQKIAKNLQHNSTMSMAPLVASLLQNYRVLIYTGDLDIWCSYLCVQNWLGQLDWPGKEEFKTATRLKWRDGYGNLGGYIKKFGKLFEFVIRNAGHMSFFDQPQWTRQLVEDFTHGQL